MERVIRELTALVVRPGGWKTAPTPRQVEADLTGAPDAVRALADALASRYYRVDLGEFSLFYNGPAGPVRSLAGSIEMACEGAEIEPAELLEQGGPGGKAFDPSRTIELGADGGGMSTLGVSWSGGVVGFVVVELADPTPDNVLTHFATPTELLAFLREKSEGRSVPDLDVLEAAAGIAAPKPAPPATSGIRIWDGPSMPHPNALAQAHFDTQQYIFQVGPSPAGRTLVMRRKANGAPPIPSVLAVLEGGAVARTVEWPVPRDILGACLVPNAERALVCSHASGGPLVEIDLATGEERERLPAVGWSCGFVDAEHVAVLGAGAVQVYRYADGDWGEPVSRMPADGFNVFVGHGRVFSRTQDRDVSIRVLSWNGSALEDEGTYPVVGAKLFALHAAAMHDGQRLVCALDTNGVPTWLAFS